MREIVSTLLMESLTAPTLDADQKKVILIEEVQMILIHFLVGWVILQIFFQEVAYI